MDIQREELGERFKDERFVGAPRLAGTASIAPESASAIDV